MTYLPDVNVWIALAVAEHVHHIAASEWFSECLRAPEHEIVFCRVTQMGFLRLLTQPKVMGKDALSAKQAWGFLDELCEGEDQIAFVAEPSDLEAEWRTISRRWSHGPNTWTDSYLAAFNEAAGSTLVTFDRTLAKRPGIRSHFLT